MPLAPEDVLHHLAAATDEAKATIRELHEARSAALDVAKKQRAAITDAIIAEVSRQVGELADAARDDLRTRAGAVVDRLEADWRTKLGLDPP